MNYVVEEWEDQKAYLVLEEFDDVENPNVSLFSNSSSRSRVDDRMSSPANLGEPYYDLSAGVLSAHVVVQNS